MDEELYLEQIEQLQAELLAKVEENELLEQMVNAGGDGAAMEALQDENERLREQVQKAKDLPKLEAELRRAKNENRVLKAGNDTLNKNFKAVSAQLATMKQSSASTANSNAKVLKQAKELAKTGKEAKAQLVKIYEENEELRTELRQASEDLKTMAEAVQLKDAVIATKDKELIETKDKLQEKELRIAEMANEYAMQQKDMETLLEGISAAEDAERLAKEEALAAAKKYEAQLEAADKKFKSLEEAKLAVDAECARLRNDTAAGRTERELDELKAKLQKTEEEKEELATEVANVQEAFLKLGKEMVQMQMDHGSQIEAARQEERESAKNVFDALESARFDLETEKEKAADLETRNLQLETDLREADEWRVKYEERWGLSEAVAYQNQLKNQLQIRDDQIAKLNYDISAAQSNIQKMDVALRILRRECGKPDDWMPAGILLEEDGLRSSREKWRHKTHELEEQNEELEAQRLRLLQKLRQQSEMSAGQGTRFFGLTPDQCDIVFQYIEELRDGGTDMPLNDKSRELQHKVNQLEAEIGKLRKHGIKTATELAAGGTVHYHEAAPQSPHSMQPMMTGAIDPSFSEGLQASLMRLFDENSKLRRDLARITQDLPHLVSELHQRQASDGESKKEDKVEQEKYEELLEERDHLQQELQSALQQVDDQSKDAVIRRWVDAKVAEFEAQQVVENLRSIAAIRVPSAEAVSDSPADTGGGEEKSSDAESEESKQQDDGGDVDESDNSRTIAPADKEFIRSGLVVVQKVLQLPNIPDDYAQMRKEVALELKRSRKRGKKEVVPEVRVSAEECQLLLEYIEARRNKDALAAKFQSYHDEQEERIVAAIRQHATPNERGARALNAASQGQQQDEGAIRAEREALRAKGMAESYDEFMADRFVQECREALRQATAKHASATAGLDAVQLSESESAEAERARFNLEVAEKRLAKAVQQRKATEDFQNAELQKLQSVLDHIEGQLSDARVRRVQQVETYRRALLDGAEAARSGLGTFASRGAALSAPSASQSASAEHTGGGPFKAAPESADGRTLLAAVTGVHAVPDDKDLSPYILRYKHMLQQVSDPSFAGAGAGVASTVEQLLAHLVLCFEEITALNGTLAKVHKVLQYVEPKIGNAAALQALLYHDHARVKADSEKECKRLRDRLETLEGDNNELRSRSEGLEQYCQTGSDAQPADEGPMTATRFENMNEDAKVATLKKFMHRVAELQLVKAKLTRRCRILRAAEELAKDGKDQLTEELREAQVIYKSRILFLELWRHGAMARIASLQTAVSSSVPKSTVSAFMDELGGLRSKYHTLLTEHSQIVLEVGVLRQAKLDTTAKTLDALPIEPVSGDAGSVHNEEHSKTNTTTTKSAPPTASASKTADDNADGNTTGGVAGTNADGGRTENDEAQSSPVDQTVGEQATTPSVALKPDVIIEKEAQAAAAANAASGKTSKEEYIEAYGGKGDFGVGVDAASMAEALVSKDGHIAKLRAELKGTRKNMRALKKHCYLLLEEARQAVDLQRKQAGELETLRKQRDSIEQQLHTVKAQAAQTGTAEELQAAKAREAAARAEAEVATRESMKHRGLLEIATAQADSLSLKHEVAKEEIATLRDQHRELAAASNDALIIGKLQQETMAKTLTYMQFARKYKAAMVQLRAKEIQNRELMKQLDTVTENLQTAQQTAHIQITASHKLLADLTGRMTGGLTMEQSEMLSRHLKDLLSECTKQEQEMERLRRRIEDSDTAKEIATADAELARRETNTLRQRILVMAQGDPPHTQPDPDTARWAAALVELSDELRSFKLANLRHQRRIASLQEDKEHLRRRFKQNATNAKVLEEELVHKDDALRKKMLGLEEGHPATTNAGNEVVGAISSSNSARAVQEALHSLLPKLAPDKGRVAADGTILAERDELDGQNRVLASMQVKNKADRATAHAETKELLSEISSLRAELQHNAKQIVNMTEQLTKARLRVKLLEGQIAAEGLVPIVDHYNADGQSRAAAEAAAQAAIDKSSGRGRGRHGDSQLAVLPEDKYVQEAAKHTTKVLKKLLQQKNKTLKRYEQRLRASRADREAERARLEAEVARLQGLLDDRNVAGATDDIREAADQVRRARGLDRRAHETAAKLERALRARVEEVEDLLDTNQKELYSAQDALAETRRRLKAAEIKNGERIAENEILRARAVETQHMAAQYPKMKARLKKVEDKLLRAKKKERRLRALLRDTEMAELEGSDFLEATSKTKKKRKKRRKSSKDDEEKNDDGDNETEKAKSKAGSDGSGSDGSGSSSSDSSSDDDGLLNDPVDGDSALAVMVRKIRRRFNKKQNELKDLKQQFESLRDELVEVTGDLEEARVAAKSTRERVLDEAKADFDEKAQILAEKHEMQLSRVKGELDAVKKDLQHERAALKSLGGNRVTAADARTVGQLQQRNAVLKHQLDLTKKKVLQQQGELQKLHEDVYVASERLKNEAKKGRPSQAVAMNTDGLAKEVKILTAQNKVLRDALSEVNAKHAKELRVAKQKAANTARANAAAVQHEAASEANKQARRALLDAQKRIQTLSQRVKDKDEVLARSRASLRAQEDRSRDLQHQLQLLKDHVANKDDDPVTAATLENEDLKSELAVLRRKNDRLQEAAAAEAQNAEQLQRRLARFRDDLIKKDEEVFQLEKEIASLRRTSTGGNPSPARPLPAPPSSNDSDTQRELEMVSKRLDRREKELAALQKRHKAELRDLKGRLADSAPTTGSHSANRSGVSRDLIQDENFDADAHRRMTYAERKLESVLSEREKLTTALNKLKNIVEEQAKQISALKNGDTAATSTAIPGWVADITRSLSNSDPTNENRDRYERLRAEYKTTRRQARDAEDRIVALERELEKMSHKLRKHGVDGSDRTVTVPHGAGTAVNELLQDKARLQGAVQSLENEAHRLKRENRDLRKELSAFDDAFFRDIEQLRERYVAAVRRNKELERKLHGRHGRGRVDGTEDADFLDSDFRK